MANTACHKPSGRLVPPGLKAARTGIIRRAGASRDMDAANRAVSPAFFAQPHTPCPVPAPASGLMSPPRRISLSMGDTPFAPALPDASTATGRPRRLSGIMEDIPVAAPSPRATPGAGPSCLKGSRPWTDALDTVAPRHSREKGAARRSGPGLNGRSRQGGGLPPRQQSKNQIGRM